MPVTPRSHRLSPLLLCITVGGCAAGPDYRAPTGAELDVPVAYASAPPAPVDPAALATWWRAFDDPVLEELVAQGLAHNRDVAGAQARLRAARASWRGARGAFWPAVGASGDSGSTHVSGTDGGSGESWQAGVDASWELDLFGGTRRGVQAAAAGVGQAQASLHDVQTSIVAEVALNYVDARNAQARMRIARENLAYQDETLQITRWRNQAGLVSAQDVELATVQRSQTAAAVPQLRATYLAAAHRLSVLTGRAPGELASRLEGAPDDVPLGPDAIATGVPAELLRRRPDLVAAERALAAEVARIGVAQAALYPALRLTGSVGSSALVPGDLGSVVASTIGASLAGPLFRGGQLRAQVEGQRASADAALAGYEGAVLGALEDVENALAAIATAKEREALLVVAEASAERAALLARQRYESGLADFESLLEANRGLLGSQESRLNAKAARAIAAVQLYKALGGGWPAPAAD